MRMIKYVLPICFFLASSISFTSLAQVTIGSHIKPKEGALLDLKQNEDNVGGQTASAGLLLPRVELKEVNKLIMGANQIHETDDDGNQYQKHTGLWVYNVTDNVIFCPGVYTWNGSLWNKLGQPCKLPLELKVKMPDLFWFYSGQYGQSLYTQVGTLQWEPQPATATWSNEAVDGYAKIVFATDGSLTPKAPWTTSPQLHINPDPMTPLELDANPFLVKKSKLVFTATQGNETASAEAVATQENKAVLINGHLTTQVVKLAATQTQYPIAVQSNATWEIVNDNLGQGNSPITAISKMAGGHDVVLEPTATRPVAENVTLTARVSSAYAPYSYLTLKDTHVPKRYADIHVTIAQCTGETDITFIKYRELWQHKYASDPATLTPDTNGDVAKNPNQVQWHTDQDNNIFFSAMFGTDRWMTVNLAAKKYAPNAPYHHTIPNDIGVQDDGKAFYAYPGADGAKGKSTAKYTARPRLGLLYSWHAASGELGRINHGGDQWDSHYPQAQGICPDGWHLPSPQESVKLEQELINHALRYSSNTDTPSSSQTARDLCDIRNSGGADGKSSTIIDGGFALLLPGMAGQNGSTNVRENVNYGDLAMLWTSASSPIWSNAYCMQIMAGTNVINMASKTGSSIKSALHPVRCVKNK